MKFKLNIDKDKLNLYSIKELLILLLETQFENTEFDETQIPNSVKKKHFKEVKENNA